MQRHSRRTLDKATNLAIADAIARGSTVSEIAAAVSVDRATLSTWLSADDMLTRVARAIGTPGSLDPDAIDDLLDRRPLDRERVDATERRFRFAAIIRDTYPDYFRERDRLAKEKREAEAKAEAERRRLAEIESAKSELEELRRNECLRADFFNLQTLVLIHSREWRDGTPGELKKGLDTPEARRAHRCRYGIKWGCAGFGVYYSPRWSAARCRVEYAGADADSISARWAAECASPDFDAVMREIEAGEIDRRDYTRDPFKRRDPALPVTAEKAEKRLKAERAKV